MAKEHQTIKIWKSTLKNLRRIYADTGVPMIQILERLVSEELSSNEYKKEINTNAEKA